MSDATAARGDRHGTPVPDLADERVEAVIAVIDGPVTIGELAGRVSGEDPEYPWGTYRDAHEALHERVLPAMAAAGTIRFDPETGLVRPPSERQHRVSAAIDRMGAHVPGVVGLAVPVVLSGSVGAYTGWSPVPTGGAVLAGLVLGYLAIRLRP